MNPNQFSVCNWQFSFCSARRAPIRHRATLRRLLLASLLLGTQLARDSVAAVPVPLPRAHAHNDYEHPRPLLDALDRGFCSVEADVHLVDGELLVGHDPPDLKPQRTLKALYLQPLRQRTAENNGWVHGRPQSVILLIDIKTGGVSTYAVLRRQLAEFASLTQPPQQGGPPPVRFIISGNRPVEAVAQDPHRVAGIDGRAADLEGKTPSDLLPLISDNWRNHFRWRGEGPMPEDQRNKLTKWVEQAHAQGRLLRFWATPENERLWTVLYEAGVDLIGTDDLERLQRFLRTRQNIGDTEE